MQVEVLLQDQAWLKALAKSLVRDDAAADDLVQDGWLAALRRPPTRHVRAWWRRVLKRRAIDLRRETERRRAREEKAPAPEAPSPELLERVELQEAVAHAIRGLAEPYRGVVLLRYFEGLPPRAIAKRLQVPVETVRTRLKRAHATLRERLEGRRDALLLLALPGAIPKLVGGMVAMVHAKKLSIAALVLLALAAWFVAWRGLGGTEPAPRAPENARAVAPPVADDEPAAPAPPPAHDGWVIAVRTITRDKAVFPGATVEARVVADGETVAEQKLATDALGAAAWLLPAFGQTVRLDLRATAPAVPDAWREVLVAAGNDPPATIEIWLGALEGSVSGRVVDTRGDPIRGATVCTSTSRATTRADGRYSLAVPTDREDIFVWASAEGFAFERVAAVLRDGRGSADLRLRPEFRIRGVVTDEEGRPVHGAVVREFFSGWYQHAVSDREGRYLLGHLDPGRDQQMLEAGHPRFASFTKQVPTVGNEVTVDIPLPRGHELAGRVEGPDGAPVAGATVTIGQGHDPVSYANMEAESGTDGTFAFGPRLAAGERPVVVDAKGLAPYARKIKLPAEGPVTIRLEAGLAITGTAVDELGRPIEIWLSARVGGEYLPRRAESDAKGRWRLEGLPSGAIDLESYGTGFQRVTMRGVEAGREDVVLTVPRAGIFRGRVVDDATGKPIPSFTLLVTSTSTPGISATWVREGYRIDDPEGAWTIAEEFAPGVIAGVEARVEGYAPGHGTATAAVEPDPDGCVVRLHRGIVIEGVVIDDETGRPVEGANVRVEPPGASRYSEETHHRQIQRTGKDGRFRFPATSHGLTLTVEHPGHAPFVLREVWEEPLTVRLHGGCVVEGITDPGGEVYLWGDSKSGEAIADATGRFRFAELPEGTYHLAKRVRLEKPPYTWFAHPVVRRIEVARGRPTDVELKPVGTATVRGTVAGTKDVEGSVVYLTRAEAKFAQSVFVRERAFELLGVEAGRYQLAVSGAVAVEIDVKEGETKAVTLEPPG